jgi:hypothetical protein
MKIYLAGFDITKDVFKGVRRLHSYYYARRNPTGSTNTETRTFEWDVENGVDIFLDSGAFSAMTQGIEIDIQEYIDFIKRYEKSLEVYANLDVIGIDGRPPDRESAEMGIANQRIMEKAGLRPIPVFHFREPFDILEQFVAEYDYIALGGAVGFSASVLIPWLDKCFRDIICDPKTGIPRVRIHGFGITSIPLLLRYPWYSVDSSSWSMGGRLGSIHVPRYRDGEWIYDERSWFVPVSNKNPGLKEIGGHIETLPPRQKQIVLDYIHAKGFKLGKSHFKNVPQTHELAENERWAEPKPKDPQAMRLLEVIEEEGLSNSFRLRNKINILYFQDLEASLPSWDRPFKGRWMKRFF